MKTSRVLLRLACFSSNLNFYLPKVPTYPTIKLTATLGKTKVAIVEKYPF